MATRWTAGPPLLEDLLQAGVLAGSDQGDRRPLACRNCLFGEVLSDVHGIAPGHRESSGLRPAAGSLAWVQATRQGHVIGAAEAEIELSSKH